LVLTKHKRLGCAFHIFIRNRFSPVTENRICHSRVRVYFKDTQKEKSGFSGYGFPVKFGKIALKSRKKWPWAAREAKSLAI
jgi:hypothetical protein